MSIALDRSRNARPVSFPLSILCDDKGKRSFSGKGLGRVLKWWTTSTSFSLIYSLQQVKGSGVSEKNPFLDVSVLHYLKLCFSLLKLLLSLFMA